MIFGKGERRIWNNRLKFGLIIFYAFKDFKGMGTVRTLSPISGGYGIIC